MRYMGKERVVIADRSRAEVLARHLLCVAVALTIAFAPNIMGGFELSRAYALEDTFAVETAATNEETFTTDEAPQLSSLQNVQSSEQGTAALVPTEQTVPEAAELAPLSDPALYLVGYKLWDANWDSVAGKEITGALDTSVLPQNGGSFVWYAALTFSLPVAISNPQDVLAQLNFLSPPPAIDGVLESASKTTTVTVDPADPNTIIIRAQDNPGSTSMQAYSRTMIKPADTTTRMVSAISAVGAPTEKAYMTFDINSISSTGVAFEQVSATQGTASTPAQATYKLKSLSLIRCANQMRLLSNGVQVGTNFAAHSHSPWTITPAGFVATIANAGTSAGISGYTFSSDTTGATPTFTVTATTAAVGESLALELDQYPTSSVDDKRILIWETLATSSASEAVKAEARELLAMQTLTQAEIESALVALGFYEGPSSDTTSNNDGLLANDQSHNASSNALPATGNSPFACAPAALCCLVGMGLLLFSVRCRKERRLVKDTR